MLIEVTAEDIRLGKRDNNCRCPVARAIGRKLKVKMSKGNVRVFSNEAVILGRDIPLSQRVIKFIKRFDAKLTVAPFSFNLKLLQPSGD